MCLVAAQKSGFGAFSDTASVMRDVRLQGANSTGQRNTF
jgi:hypothetical protein